MYKAAIKFIRLPIMITCSSLVFMGSVAAGAITVKTLLAIFAFMACYIHAASTNDYSDRHIDAVNLQNANDRPLVSKDISFSQLWIIHSLSGILALILSAFYGINAVILAIVILVINYTYSLKPFRISDRGAMSQLVLAIAYVYYPFSLGYWASGTNIAYPWLLSAGLYLGFVARLFLKDFRDVKGDKKYGKMTFLLRHGAVVTCIVSGILGITSLSIMLYVTKFNPGLSLILVIGQVIAIRAVYRLSKLTSIEEQTRAVASLAKTANISVITILAYFLCLSQHQLSTTEASLIPVILGLIMLLLNGLHAIDQRGVYVRAVS